MVATGGLLGNNMFAYCRNNPVNMVDAAGNLPQWLKDLWEEITGYFDSDSNTVSGKFESGIIRGEGSLTGGYSEFNWRLDDKFKSANTHNGWIGGFCKVSAGNGKGKIGIGNDNIAVSVKAVADILVGTLQAGLHYNDGFGVGAKAKASVFSGRITGEFNLFGWQVEYGVSGEALSIGYEKTFGIFPSDDGGWQFNSSGGYGAGWYGWGYTFRVKVPA